MTGGVDDENDSYDGEVNPNFIIIELQLHSNFHYSPSFTYQQSNNLALRPTNPNKDEDDDNDDDDDPWLLTDGTYWFYILFIR